MSHPFIQTASLTWSPQGTPISSQFADVYFSHLDGLAETRYVFLQGNQLVERWSSYQQHRFTVAEAGFGTGLNFLALWQAFHTFKQQNPKSPLTHLHYISFEQYPFSQNDLITIHQRWPELQPFSGSLHTLWPRPLPGCQRLHFAEGEITLDLWFGDINQQIKRLPLSLNGQIDAWFLDGFAPAKNPDMWTPQIFNTLAHLTKPYGTFATFTAASIVRRGLQEAGFQVSKIKGFAHKREMLIGSRSFHSRPNSQAPWFERPAAQDPHDIAIIGGGIAAALISLALLQRGSQITLYCADAQPAQGASGNHQGILLPLLNGQDDLLEHFFAHAFTFARRYYDRLSTQGVHFDHQWCGVTQVSWNDKSYRKNAKISASPWPTWLVQAVNAETLSQLLGLPLLQSGLHYPQGGWLSPAQLTQAAFALAEQQGAQLHFHHALTQLTPIENHWSLRFSQGKSIQHSSVVLAHGEQLTQLAQTSSLPLYPVRGQVSHIPTTPMLRQLRHVLCYDGYLTPINPANQHHCLGASHQRYQRETHYCCQEQQANRQRLIESLVGVSWPHEVDITTHSARVGIRCAVRDHFPMVGVVPDYAATLATYQDIASTKRSPGQLSPAPSYPNLFMIGGLGARGLCTAPLCAELLAAQIHNEVLPLPQDMLDALQPNRMWIRKQLKGRPLSPNKYPA